MTWIGLLLVLGTSLGWAGLDGARKGLAAVLPAVPLVFLLNLAQVPFFVAWVAYAGTPDLAAGYVWAGLGTVALNVAANLLFVQAVALSPLSATVPLLALTPVFSALVALFLHAEFPTVQQWVGILTVVAGAFLLNANADELRRPAALFRALAREPGAPRMAAVALLWSVSSNVDKLGAQLASPSMHGLVQVGGMTLCLLVWLLVSGGLSQVARVRQRPGLFAFAATAAVVALGLQLLAYPFVYVSVLESIKRGVGLASALVVGWLAYGERPTAVRIVAVTAMAAGTALILL